jgi:hypothetical protein
MTTASREHVGCLKSIGNPLVLEKWIDTLRPASGLLEAPLADIVQDGKIGEARKIAACEVVAAYGADGPAQFQVLEKRLVTPLRGGIYDEQKTALAKQKADIAAALWRMNQYEKMAYHPAIEHGNLLVAKTLLLPGMEGMPEEAWAKMNFTATERSNLYKWASARASCQWAKDFG